MLLRRTSALGCPRRASPRSSARPEAHAHQGLLCRRATGALSRLRRPHRLLLHTAPARLRRQPPRARRRLEGPRPTRPSRRHPGHARQPPGLGALAPRVLGQHRPGASQQTGASEPGSRRPRRPARASRRSPSQGPAQERLRRPRHRQRRSRTTPRGAAPRRQLTASGGSAGSNWPSSPSDSTSRQTKDLKPGRISHGQEAVR